MKTTWIKGLDEKSAEEIRLDFKSSKLLRGRLIELCKEGISSSYELSRSQYDCPNWQMLQADSIGYRRAMEKIISLLE